VSLVLNHRRTNAKVLSSIKESAVVYRNSELSKSLSLETRIIKEADSELQYR